MDEFGVPKFMETPMAGSIWAEIEIARYADPGSIFKIQIRNLRDELICIEMY